MTSPKARIKAYTLNVTQIVKTIERLQLRIAARFPGSGLANVCADLVQRHR